MKHSFCTVFLLLALVTVGCSPNVTAVPLPTIALDRNGATLTSVKASAVVVPAQEAQLSFVISGLVKDIFVEEGQQVQAGQALVSLEASDLEFAVAAAEAALRAAELDATIQRYRRKYTNDAGKVVYLSGPREQILKADAKVAQMKAMLEIAKASLEQSALVAPFAGTIVAVDLTSGEYVQPAQGVVTIANLDGLQIETTDLGELNVAAIKVGQPATIFVEALDKSFSGKVTTISPISETIGGDVVFKVTIQLNEQPVALRWGMSADVEISVE